MIGMVISGHGEFAPGITDALEMIAGKQDLLFSIPLTESRSLPAFEDELESSARKLKEKAEGVIFFVDLIGGTPFRCAMSVSAKTENSAVVVGSNLPMLIEAALSRASYADAKKLAVWAGEAGMRSIEVAELPAESKTNVSAEGVCNMPNILLTRIDNRLIHGQVATMWTSFIGANLILVANDNAAADPMRQRLMDMAAPNGVQTRYFTLKKTIEVIHKASAKQKIFIICENPADVLTLVEGGVPIKEVNIGNMHMAEGKRQVATTVAVDDSDVKAFQQLERKGVKLVIRRVPQEATESKDKLYT